MKVNQLACSELRRGKRTLGYQGEPEMKGTASEEMGGKQKEKFYYLSTFLFFLFFHVSFFI